MKLPLSWITEIIDLKIPPHQIAELLTHAGLEVDAYYPLPIGFENIVVGEVTEAKKHPEADQLQVATVFDGQESFQVVCAASNCRKGLKTAFARVGGKLTDSEGKTMKIKKTKLRGVESFGMLCSEVELGLGQEAQGIIEFTDLVKPGADVAEMYGDTIFEISLTPNLGHCASVVGVARELSAATGEAVKLPMIQVSEAADYPVDEMASVRVEDEEKCPMYACRVIRDVKMGPSPLWLQKRLLACDLRPVNNIVDVTNYALMELGHPLHAFDFQKVDEHKIVVRKAEDGERFTTLDGKERSLVSDDLLICDGNKPIAIAGVMGGENSEVGDNTKHVILESALFEATGIRRTSKRLGLQTEASRRFERGCDPKNVIRALDRAAMLIQEVAGGTVCQGVVEVTGEKWAPKTIVCRLSRINQVLGTKLSLSEVEDVFHKLEMDYQWDGQDVFTVTPPSYRVDLNEEVDLLEEVARIYGFENIPKPLPHYTSSMIPHAKLYLFENKIRRRLLSEGLQELVTCDLVGPSLLDIIKEKVMPEDAYISVLNPTSVEQSILRTSLLPGALQTIKHNYDRDIQHFGGFEIGRVHFKRDENFLEQSVAGIVLSGKKDPIHWSQDDNPYDFFDLKGIVENILESLSIDSLIFKNNDLKIFHPGRQASIFVNSLEIGSLGEVHPAIVRRLDVPQRILFAEIDLQQLLQLRTKEVSFKDLAKFPRSTRDQTLTLVDQIPIQEVFNVINSISSRLLESVTLKAIYRGEKVGEGKKNVTFHFVYRDKKKTVAQEAVDAEHARITSQIEEKIMEVKV